MNVVITLPQNLWRLMLEGKKTAEIRKTIPMRFNERKDVVFINLKGHKQIVGYLSGLKMEQWFPHHWLYWYDVDHIHTHSVKIGERCGVPKSWIRDYVGDEKMLWAWCFDEVHELDNPIELSQIVPTGKAPQAYVYTEFRL